MASLGEGDNECTQRIYIEGMTCQNCVQNLESTIGKIDGISSIEVSLEEKVSKVDFDVNQIKIDDIIERINEMGFHAELVSNQQNNETIKEKNVHIKIDNMSDQNCVQDVEEKLKSLIGVISCRVTLGKATLQYDANKTNEDHLLHEFNYGKFRASLVISESNSSHIIDVELGGIADENISIAQDRISSIDGVRNVYFPSKFDASHAQISYDSNQIDQYTLLETIQSIGYQVTLQQLSSDSITNTLCHAHLHVQGMHCNSCVMNITSTVQNLPGIYNIKVSFEDQLAIVVFDKRVIQLSIIVKEVENLGFQVATTASSNDGTKSTQDDIDSDERFNTHLLHESIHQPISKSRVQRMNNNNDEKDTETCFLTILGMTCASCVDTIQRNLTKVQGISSVLVALLSHKAEIKYYPEYIMPTQIAHLINELGFRAEVLESIEHGIDSIDLHIGNMTCASCVGKIETSIGKLSGIHHVEVALLTHRGRFKYDSSQIGPRDIIQKLDVSN